MTQRRNLKKLKGFNLVEAAIVLGVVGLVIGGIWVAASIVTENQRINNAITGIESFANQYRNLYVGMPSSSVPRGSWIRTNIFSTIPAGWTYNAADINSYPVSPWGGGVYIDAGGTVDNPDVEFYFYSVPRSRCIALLVGISKLPNYANTRHTLATANTFCNQAVMSQVAFSFFVY